MKKNSSDNIPAFQFYPNDWLGDMNLRMCSVGTRGVWIDLLCLMHKSKKYGFLVHKVDEKWSNMSPKTIQKLTGLTTKRIIIGIQELSKNDVLKYDEHGLIYSKRMVKDHALRVIRKEVGKLGGNPILVNQSPNQTGNQKSTPSSSPSFSPSPSASKKPKPPIVPQGGNGIPEGFEEFYQAYPKKKNKPDAKEAWKQIFLKSEYPKYHGPVELSFILASVENHKRSFDWCKNGGQYIPLPATWLRAHGFNDSPYVEIKQSSRIPLTDEEIEAL